MYLSGGLMSKSGKHNITVSPSGHALPKRLREIYHGEALLIEAAQLAPFESDALTAFHQTALAAVFPRTTEEIAATVRACYELDVPFLARVSRTSLSGGSLPIAGGLLIALSKMNRSPGIR